MKKININYKKILISIFVIACLFRIIFISFAKIDNFQYDVGITNLKNSEDYEKVYQRNEDVFVEDRHIDYILEIYETGKLPDTNEVQKYHPPLHHSICAIWLRIINIFQFSAEIELESLQILTCIYSIITLFGIYKILEELKINDKLKIIAILICGFHPIFVYMSGLINNDTLLTMFSVLSILYLLKWYKNSTYKNTIFLAIMIGLGGLTKSSILVNFVLVVIIAFIKFLEELYNENYKKVKDIILQGIVFILISVPLILSYPIRNYVLFEQPFFSVHDAAEWLYVGNDNLLNRFGIFNNEILDNTLRYEDENILSYVVKSAIVFKVGSPDVFGTTVVKILSLVFIVISVLSIIKLVFSKDKQNYLLIIAYVLWILFFVSFNYQMPNSCTMHSRYIITAIVLSILCLMRVMQQKKSEKFENILIILSVVFSVGSIMTVLLNIL